MATATATCATCGEDVPVEPTNTSRVPCQFCGSVGRKSSHALESSLKVSGSIAAVAMREGETTGFAESGSTEMKRHTTFTPDGKVVLNLAGLSPKNEQDTREVSEFLATFLNDRGINATLCTENPNKKAEKNKEQGVDHWLLIDGKPVGIQVVRALRTPEFWKKLNHDGKVSELYLTPQQCADSLREAITHKEPKIGREQRPNLILLLDAYRIPAFALGPVVKQFKEVHTATVRELGFHSVYVVGPTSAFVSRLDQ